ncbi:MAG: FkbM family methyltransferase [Acidobacteriota bacterium]
MIENQLQAPNPESATAERETASHPQSIAIAQIAKAVAESIMLQARFNQTVKAGMQDLADGIAQTREMLQKHSLDLTRRIEALGAATSAGGRFAVPVGNDLLLTRVLNSFLMYVEASDMSLTPQLVTAGFWEKAITQAFLTRLKPGMTVVDVGANYGYYSLAAACRVGEKGRVYSFEPNPRTFEILKRNIEVNWLGRIIRPHQLAVLDSRKQVKLHVLRRFQASSSLFPPELVPESDPPADEWRSVEAVPLDEIVQEKVDLIKIDAEGSEPLVLEGMRGILDRSPDLTIFMEINIPMIQKTTDAGAFLKKIRELGGTMHYFTPWGSLEPYEEEKALRFELFNLLIDRK